MVWIDPQRWPAILAAHGLANAPALLADWARNDRPLIARRPVVGELPCLVPLGLPLPPSIGKQRLAFAVPPDAIRADALPPLLRDAAAAAPPPGRTASPRSSRWTRTRAVSEAWPGRI
ncbi:hypothetical protein [Sphingomonas aerolata]|uniref:hypothetical protein n=1 Tax=Sphingomonas aerolata TaxID=185951 RepID=UPI003A5C631A